MPRNLSDEPLKVKSERVSWISPRSEEHTSELQSRQYLVCRLLLEKKKPHLCTAASASQLAWRCHSSPAQSVTCSCTCAISSAASALSSAVKQRTCINAFNVLSMTV